MEIFNGNGAECMVKFIADGCKGHISVNDGRMLFGKVAWNVRAKKDVWEIDWLAEPCRYTPPESQWVECSPGEALDVYLRVGNLQENSGSGWVDMTYDTAWEWMWVNKGVKYRKEV